MLTVAACGGSGSATKTTGGGTSTTLNTPLSFDPGSLDPDLFYGNEGLEITTRATTGCFATRTTPPRSSPTSQTATRLDRQQDVHVPAAPQREVHRRHPVQLRSHGLLDEASPRRQRRPRVHGQADRKLETSNPNARDPSQEAAGAVPGRAGIAVRPTSDQPDARQGARGDDNGQKWLANHCAGTGPYTLAKADPGKATRSLPTRTTGGQAVLQDGQHARHAELLHAGAGAETGQLDMMTHGLPLADIKHSSDPSSRWSSCRGSRRSTCGSTPTSRT